MTDSRSAKLFNRAKQVIPGGVNSPVRAFSSVGGVPPFIKKAEGAHIWDEDGKRYIDYVGTWGPAILGHAHPEVISAIQQVVTDGTSFGAPTEKEIMLAEMIIDRVPGCDMVRLVNSGTEATMSAIRLARGITGRDKIIKFDGCYHGHGDSFLIAAGSGALTLGEPNSPGVTRGTAKDTLIAQFNKIESVSELFDKFSEDIAAVIVEPVNGNTGCIPPQNDFLNDLKKLCGRAGSLVIFYEVMTGLRVANITPDLFTFGKVIGGGLPIGAYGGKKEHMEQIAPSGPVYQAGTLSGNPVAVTAGIETLKLLNDEAYDSLERSGAYLQNAIQSIINENALPLFQQRVASMFCLYFHPGPIANTNDVASCDFDGFNRYFHSLLESGVYIAPSQYETGFISLAHNKHILDETIDIISHTLKEFCIPV